MPWQPLNLFSVIKAGTIESRENAKIEDKIGRKKTL
jgi:hypothetical protein